MIHLLLKEVEDIINNLIEYIRETGVDYDVIVQHNILYDFYNIWDLIQKLKNESSFNLSKEEALKKLGELDDFGVVSIYQTER